MTTLNGLGFDIQQLWEQSKSISPPHHLNFYNTKSISLLLESSGFEIVEIATPGKLDWDIVEGMIKDKEERIFFLEEQLGADVYPDTQEDAEDDGI